MQQGDGCASCGSGCAEGERAAVIAPRFAWFPPRARSLGRDCIDFWKAAGGSLFEWQEFVIEGILGLDADDRFVSKDDGLAVSRQNGKGVILQAIETFVAFELGTAFGYDLVMHTAHEVPTSLEHQLRMEEIIQNCPSLHAKVRDVGGYRHANGQESIRLKDGTRIVFKARTRGSGRGYSGDLLVWDEAMEIPDHVVAAQKPSTRASTARHGQKTIYAGSAVDQTIHVNGRMFSLIRKRGIEQTQRVSWAEWSAPFDHPDEMTDDDLRALANQRAGNPSMADGLISEETVAGEVEVMPRRVAAVELFGAGDWPDPDGNVETVVPIDLWDGGVNSQSRAEAPYSLFVDVSPDRWTAIALAGRNEAGSYHVEIQEFREGSRWAVKWLSDRWQRSGHDIYAIGLDGLGPAAALAVELEEAGVPVERFTSTEMAESCGRFVDLVSEGEIEHLGSAELRDAILGAATRPLLDRFAWARRSSRTNIAPLVAATGAVGLAAGVATGDLAVF